MTQTHGYRTGFIYTASAAATAWMLMAACSSDAPQGSGIHDPQNLEGSGVKDGGSTGGSGGGAMYGGGTTSTGGSLNPDEICDSVDFAAEPMPVDMYIMLDQSTSMDMTASGSTETKWVSVTNAIKAFVNAAEATGIGVGLQYFGLPNPLAPESNYQECDPAKYAVPEIEIADLPGAAGAIVNSIDSHSPSSLTPTGPALQGAIEHMKAWAPLHAGRAAVVVLVTDGFPTECANQQIAELQAIAETAATTDPVVRTFVIGIGEGFANLNNIAFGGGTGSAFLIESGDVQQQFLSAMLNIASTPLQCEFDIPTPTDTTMQFNKDKVQVVYAPWSTGVEEEIPKVQVLSDCDLNMGNGWYYDYEADPTKILICPDTCKRFAAGHVTIKLGCTPKPGIIR